MLRGVTFRSYLATGMAQASQVVLGVKNPPASSGDANDEGLIPGSGRSPGVENNNILQYFCLENSMDRGAWQAIVHGVAESQTQLSPEPMAQATTNPKGACIIRPAVNVLQSRALWWFQHGGKSSFKFHYWRRGKWASGKAKECDQDFTANEHRSQGWTQILLTTVCTLSCCFFRQL